MPTDTITKDPLKAARAALAKPISYNLFLEKLGAKDRLNAEKHVAACDTGPDPRHAKLWQRLACAMMTLASHQAKVNGQQSMQFYVPDGKYRKQVFALEDLRQENVTVYCADVLDKAVKSKLLQPGKAAPGELPQFKLAKGTDTLLIERLDGTTANPAEFYKHMIGWHRKALKITVPISASDSQIDAVETLCALSVQNGTA